MDKQMMNSTFTFNIQEPKYKVIINSEYFFIDVPEASLSMQGKTMWSFQKIKQNGTMPKFIQHL